MCNALKNSFVIAVFLTILTGCAKGESDRITTIQRLGRAMEYTNQATKILNRGSAFMSVDESEMREVKRLWAQALAETRQIDYAILDKEEPRFGQKCRDQFLEGLRLCVEGDGQGDFVKGQLLMSEFSDEYSRVLAKKKRR